MDYQLLKGVENEVDYLFLTGTLTQNNVFYKVAVVESVDYSGGGTGNYQVILQSQAGTFSFLIYKNYESNRWVRESEETDAIDNDIDIEEGVSAGEIIVEQELFSEVSDPIVFPMIDADVIQEIGATIEQIKKE